MSLYTEAERHILDRYGRRSGSDRRVVQRADTFPFDRRKDDERRKSCGDRRRSLADRLWGPS